MAKYSFTKVDVVPKCKNHPDKVAAMLEYDLCWSCIRAEEKKIKSRYVRKELK